MTDQQAQELTAAWERFHGTGPDTHGTRQVFVAGFLAARAPVPVERPDARVTAGLSRIGPNGPRLPEQPDEGEKGGIVNGEWLSETTLRALYRYLDTGPRLGEVTRALGALAARPTVPEGPA